MSDTCESCGCPEGVDGHDVLYRQIDDLKKVANVCEAIGTMDAEERSVLCDRIKELETTIIALHGALHSHHKQEFSADKCPMDYCQMARKVIAQ